MEDSEGDIEKNGHVLLTLLRLAMVIVSIVSLARGDESLIWYSAVALTVYVVITQIVAQTNVLTQLSSSEGEIVALERKIANLEAQLVIADDDEDDDDDDPVVTFERFDEADQRITILEDNHDIFVAWVKLAAEDHAQPLAVRLQYVDLLTKLTASDDEDPNEANDAGSERAES